MDVKSHYSMTDFSRIWSRIDIQYKQLLLDSLKHLVKEGIKDKVSIDNIFKYLITFDDMFNTNSKDTLPIRLDSCYDEKAKPHSCGKSLVTRVCKEYKLSYCSVCGKICKFVWLKR